ncbi:cellulose biosynthesis cyclic di-GMP-binding regulatory protein BcsB [Blautia schinkii]|nr:cellulose biosynthesis cyclic di-GMP-binding regulatory protein BcsB [Blautia schinkii]
MAGSRKRIAISAVLFILLAFIFSGMRVEAAILYQTDKDEVLADIMDSAPEDAEEPDTQAPQVSAENYKNFAYSEDIVLSGIFQTNTFYFEVPEYWDSSYAYAMIQVELSQLIQDVPASLTFMVNNVPVTSYKMDYQNGKTQTFYVEIPIEMVKEGYNNFDVTGYARVYDEEGCLDDFSGANWISISKDSFIQVGYGLKEHDQMISNYPYPFISTVDEDGSSTYIAVSDALDEKELEAALMVRADLGSETAMEDDISLVSYSVLPKSVGNKIIISLYDHLDEELRQEVQEGLGDRDLKTQAMIKFMEDESNNPLLLITSENGDCLVEAVTMLLDENRVSQEKVSQTFVKEGSAQIIKEVSASSDMIAGRYTLEELTESGLRFIGPFHQTADIYLPFSGGYVLSDAGKIVLKFRYSENLDFRRSMITVYWGDVPVASKKLSKENAGGDELSFTMPEDVIGTYAGKISVAFELELPDLFCTPRMDEMPWAYVTEDSVFYLPVGTESEYSFSSRPYPFEISSMFHDLLVVIPDEITEEELDTLGHIIAMYGESISPYGELLVKRAGELSSDSDKAGNIITIGNYNDNSFIKELNDKLYFRYNEDGTAFESNGQLVLSEDYAKRIASLQLLYSPYAEDKAILVAGALNDTTLSNLRSFIREDKNVWKLEKDTVLIDDELEIKTFEMAAAKKEQKQPVLKTVLETNKDSVIFAIVATSVMLLLLLAVILILIRIYWRQRKK